MSLIKNLKRKQDKSGRLFPKTTWNSLPLSLLFREDGCCFRVKTSYAPTTLLPDVLAEEVPLPLCNIPASGV